MTRLLYILNAALLVAHEVDSAYWKEWELFGFPGGEGGFVVLHVALGAAVVWGYGQVLAATPTGRALSLILAGCGIAAFLVHGAFLLVGRNEFRAPVSLLILIAIGPASVAQAWEGMRSSRSGRGPALPDASR